jgi:hypothetical protein
VRAWAVTLLALVPACVSVGHQGGALYEGPAVVRGQAAPEPGPPPRPTIVDVQPGMTTDQVEELLGRPDEVRTAEQRPVAWPEDAALTWTYRKAGTVHFGADGGVVHVVDAAGEPRF